MGLSHIMKSSMIRELNQKISLILRKFDKDIKNLISPSEAVIFNSQKYFKKHECVERS